jgi:hypothetical protein
MRRTDQQTVVFVYEICRFVGAPLVKQEGGPDIKYMFCTKGAYYSIFDGDGGRGGEGIKHN